LASLILVTRIPCIDEQSSRAVTSSSRSARSVILP
jgi:hypothetical protein